MRVLLSTSMIHVPTELAVLLLDQVLDTVVEQMYAELIHPSDGIERENFKVITVKHFRGELL